MIMEFEQLLKKREKNIVYYSFFTDSNFVLDNPKLQTNDVINVEDLGEWAWKRLELDTELRYGQTWDEEELLKEIATACLGKKEIKKRIEKMKHNQRYDEGNK